MPKKKAAQNVTSYGTPSAKLNPYKRGTFELYRFWRLMPVQMFQMTDEEFENHNIDDDEFRILASIKTKGAFAQRYGVRRETLSDWDKSIESDADIHQIRTMMQRLTKNVVYAHYLSATGQGRNAAQDRQSWYKYIERLDENPEQTRELEKQNQNLTAILHAAINGPDNTGQGDSSQDA